MCSELTPRAHISDTRIPQLMQPWLPPSLIVLFWYKGWQMWMTTKWCGSPPSTSDHYWGWCEGEHFWWEMEEHWIWTARWCDRMWKRRNLTRQDRGRGGAQVVREGPTRLFGILAPKIRTCGWLWVPPKVGYTSSSTDSFAPERLYCRWKILYNQYSEWWVES